jgi:trehalose-phosphatase
MYRTVLLTSIQHSQELLAIPGLRIYHFNASHRIDRHRRASMSSIYKPRERKRPSASKHMDQSLLETLRALARRDRLIVASDFDGTLAPLVDDHAAPTVHRAALAVLRELASLPATHVALITGRSLADLDRLLGPACGELRFGSHGLEGPGLLMQLSAEQLGNIERLADSLQRIAEAHPGVSIERKPAGVAFHFRRAVPDVQQAAIQAAQHAVSTIEPLYTKRGHDVIEYSLLRASKHEALSQIHASGAMPPVIYLGDDLTDEDIFARLRPQDCGVKVGPGPTAAHHRVAHVESAVEVLQVLASLRREASLKSLVNLHACGVLADHRTLAVVAPGASICWLCLPRADSSSVFASLIDGPDAGHFTIAPIDDRSPLEVAYEGSSLTLKTMWPGLTVTDELLVDPLQSADLAAPTILLRSIEGTAPCRVTFAPRLSFGAAPTRLQACDDGLKLLGAPVPMVLHSPGVRWRIIDDGPHHTAVADLEPSEGSITLDLIYGERASHRLGPARSDAQKASRRLWDAWLSHLRVPPLYSSAVCRSALMLKALCYAPTGAILAAATTSLPESLGGERNWDYRFCWPRDAAIAAASLVRLGSNDEALAFLDFMLGIVGASDALDCILPLYTIAGEQAPSEATLTHLAGYSGSRPVRVGNAAAGQVQLDVYGPLLDLFALLIENGAAVTHDHLRFVRQMVQAIMDRWQEPDHGIWEIRLSPRHHTHSRVMCWQGLRRARDIERLTRQTIHPDLEMHSLAIATQVLREGWSDKLNSFRVAFDTDELDAAVLSVGLTGLVSVDDERWRATVMAVDKSLRDGPTVRRYHMADGLQGREGGMHICTGWLIQSLVSINEIQRARSLFEQFLALQGSTGVLTEQFDPQLNLPLGNLPQAYSHAALIDAAIALNRAIPASNATQSSDVQSPSSLIQESSINARSPR